MRLISILDHQLVKPELCLDLAKRGRVRFVQTQPHDLPVAACNCADFLNRHIADPLAVPVERAGNNPRARDIGGDGEVEHISQRP